MPRSKVTVVRKTARQVIVNPNATIPRKFREEALRAALEAAAREMLDMDPGAEEKGAPFVAQRKVLVASLEANLCFAKAASRASDCVEELLMGGDDLERIYERDITALLPAARRYFVMLTIGKPADFDLAAHLAPGGAGFEMAVIEIMDHVR